MFPRLRKSIALLATVFLWAGLFVSSVNAASSTRMSAKERAAAIETEKALMKQYLPKFLSAVSSGSLDTGLEIYEELLSRSQNTVWLTGADAHFSSGTLEKVSLISKEIEKNKSDSGALSKTLIDAGNIEYAIGTELYYTDKKSYQLAILYHYLRACYLFDESNSLKENAAAHKYKGIVMLDIGAASANDAIKELKRAIELDKNDVQAYYKLGNTYSDRKDYKSAIDAYLAGLAIDKNYEAIYLNLWIVYFENKDRVAGYKAFNDGLSICKDKCYIIQYNLGNEYSQDKELEKALTAYDLAIAGAKQHGDVYRNAYFKKGETLYFLKRYSEAIRNLKWSINNPKDPQVRDNQFNQNQIGDDYSYLLIIYSFGQLNDYSNAKIFLDRAVKLFPKSKRIQDLYKSTKGK